MSEAAEAALSEAVQELDINGVAEEDPDKPREPIFTEMKEQLAPKKKKRKGKNRAKNPRPSGFEENHVEGPLTLAAAQEEQDLYHPSKPFSERIEICIQRYKAKRKFDPIRSQIFTTYLNLGGISTGQKQFSGGLDIKQNDHMDSEQLATMAATEFVSNMENDDEWEVDFPYVVRGFLSHRVPYVLGYIKIADLELAAQVVRNFLNYVLYHNVAPEHVDGINQAIQICDLAEKELVLCRHVSYRLPGNFNMACSTLYDGYYAGMKDPSQTWDEFGHLVGLTPSEATEIFNACVRKRGTAEQKKIGLEAEAIKGYFMGMEVIGIVFPIIDKGKVKDDELKVEKAKDEAVKGENAKENRDEGADNKKANDADAKEAYEATGMQALGRLIVKPWSSDEKAPANEEIGEFEIWLEMEILQFCFTGMHLEAKVHRLSTGVTWIDSITAVQCSFYLHLNSPSKAGLGSPAASDDEFEALDH